MPALTIMPGAKTTSKSSFLFSEMFITFYAIGTNQLFTESPERTILKSEDENMTCSVVITAVTRDSTPQSPILHLALGLSAALKALQGNIDSRPLPTMSAQNYLGWYLAESRAVNFPTCS